MIRCSAPGPLQVTPVEQGQTPPVIPAVFFYDGIGKNAADLSIGSAGGGGAITNDGTLRKSGGAGTSFNTNVVPITNTGTLDVQSGTFADFGTFTHATGAVLSGSATTDLSNAAIPLFDGNVNPGTSPGILALTGNYTPTTNSQLNIELDGITVGTQYDRLDVSGLATLTNGTLNVTLGGGFTPQGEIHSRF